MKMIAVKLSHYHKYPIAHGYFLDQMAKAMENHFENVKMIDLSPGVWLFVLYNSDGCAMTLYGEIVDSVPLACQCLGVEDMNYFTALSKDDEEENFNLTGFHLPIFDEKWNELYSDGLEIECSYDNLNHP